MDETTLDAVKRYIINEMNSHPHDCYKVTLSGGEPCLYDTKQKNTLAPHRYAE